MINILIGLGAFGDEETSVFQSLNIVNNFYRVELTKAIFDEIHLRNRINISYDEAKTDWQLDTILLAKFQNSLAGGNIDLAGELIEFLSIRKRKIDELTWSNVINIPYNPEINIYEYVDKFVEAGEIYEYAILPVAFGGFEGKYILEQIEAKFESTWLFNKNEIYKLIYNLEYGVIDTIVPNSIFEPVGAEYPIVNYNGNLKYKRGNIKCLLVSNNSINGKIDIRQEKLERKQLLNFLTDRKPKILKDAGGNYMMVSIIGSPQLVPNNNLAQRLYEVNFEFIEIGNPYDETTLKQSGLK